MGRRNAGARKHLPALAMGLVLALGACGQPPPYRHEFAAFGTQVRLEIRDAEPNQARAAAAAVEADFRRVDRDWYAYGDGELARVNQALLAGQRARLSPELLPLVRRAMGYYQQSGGVFDPAVCALVRLWRFDREENLAMATDRPPPGEVQALRARQGHLADLVLEGDQAWSRRPLCIDLGGMAKGTALERARRILVARGIGNALVDLGGSSLLALGPPAGQAGRPWRVGLQDPRSPGVLGALELRGGETLDTSGDYERAFGTGSRRYHHILDPGTGEPAAGVASVTVISGDGERGDVASTALLAGGVARFQALASALGIPMALLITTDGQVLATPPMAERLQQANGGQLPRVPWAKAPR